MDLDQLKHVFRSESDTEIPLLDERLKVLNEAGKVLLSVSGWIVSYLCF